MATVPVYQTQVRERPLEGGIQQTPDVSSNLMRAGQGLTTAGAAAMQIAEVQSRTKADEVDSRISTEWLKWDAENRNKYRGDSVGQYEAAASTWWKTAAQEFGKDLDPRARQMASGSLLRKQGAAMANVVQFVGAERERHADDTASANITTAIQFGVSTGDVAGAAEQVRGQVAAIGARKGWNTQQVQAAQLQNLSALHLAQITKLANSDAAQAEAYYQANKLEVSAQNQPRVEEIIRGEGDNQFATQFAAGIANQPLADQLAEAAKIQNPQRREKALTQIRNNYALVKQAEQERENHAADQAWQLYSRGQRVPEAILSQMSGRERFQLQDSQRVRSERAAAGKPVKTDMTTYIDVREKLARGEKVDLRAYTEKIGGAQMEQLLDIQTRASSGGAKQDAMITDEGRINNALSGLGIDKKKNPQAAVAITTEIDRRVRAASAAKGGKDLTADEKQAIVDRVTLDKVYVNEWGRDPQKPLALITPEEMDKAYVRVNGKNVLVSSVPSTDRRQIIQALQATGQPITEQAVVEMYLAGKKGAR